MGEATEGSARACGRGSIPEAELKLLDGKPLTGYRSGASHWGSIASEEEVLDGLPMIMDDVTELGCVTPTLVDVVRRLRAACKPQNLLWIHGAQPPVLNRQYVQQHMLVWAPFPRKKYLGPQGH